VISTRIGANLALGPAAAGHRCAPLGPQTRVEHL